MNKEQKLTMEDGLKALGVHVVERGYQLRQKYGKFIDYSILVKILKDEEFVRFPTEIIFDSTKVGKGMFATVDKISTNALTGYIIYVHEYFKNRLADVPALVLYQLVSINYGDFATYNEAEEFGAMALGMEKEEYYQLLCRLADSIPGNGTE